MEGQNYSSLLSYVPFVGLMLNDPSIQSPISVRLVETAIMSVVAGGFSMYVTVQVLSSDIRGLKEAIIKVEGKVEQVDTKLEKVRTDLYIPRGASNVP